MTEPVISREAIARAAQKAAAAEWHTFFDAALKSDVLEGSEQ